LYSSPFFFTRQVGKRKADKSLIISLGKQLFDASFPKIFKHWGNTLNHLFTIACT
jgi:hypothetical protein